MFEPFLIVVFESLIPTVEESLLEEVQICKSF